MKDFKAEHLNNRIISWVVGVVMGVVILGGGAFFAVSSYMVRPNPDNIMTYCGKTKNVDEDILYTASLAALKYDLSGDKVIFNKLKTSNILYVVRDNQNNSEVFRYKGRNVYMIKQVVGYKESGKQRYNFLAVGIKKNKNGKVFKERVISDKYFDDRSVENAKGYTLRQYGKLSNQNTKGKTSAS
ncbi:hypothetical protein [Companilactobacillus mishanensis]|uniref:Uncharacterized protein n=1 Tax=Companilactobacillus mishanensis TaxID=2486008 RepID=A0ABW9PA39_9LACO|nr:hypothetical protein [Companilactobacillus mishanensis]MQS45917.1 hypothetical protein [Companilactobacillus mishanensis]MQS89982.1 hypothetical protein [Companilactobacillus mishanensis]